MFNSLSLPQKLRSNSVICWWFKQNDAYHFYQDLSRIEVKIQSADSQNCFLPITDERERSRSPELLYPPIANIAEVSKSNYQKRKNLV